MPNNPIPSTDVTDFLSNVSAFDRAINQAGTYPDRFGVVRKTLPQLLADGQDDVNEMISEGQADINNFLSTQGFLPPVLFESGLNANTSAFTVEYSGQVYRAKASSVPFTTTGTFNAAQWELLSGVSRQELAASGGAELIGTSAGITLQQQLDILTSRKAVVTSPQFAGGANGSSYAQDTAAINAAIAYAGTGGIVVFPPLAGGAEYKAVGIRPLTGQAWFGYGREQSCIAGDGSDITVWTNRYPATSYTVRNVRFIGLKFKNAGKLALALHGAPDSAIYDCQTEATGGVPSFSQILSVRCKVNGNRFLSSGVSHAAEWLDNCNGTDAAGNTISGGNAGSGFIVGSTQTLGLDLTRIEVAANFGGSIASRRVLGIGFTNGEAVTITAVDGTGAGATGTAVVVDGILSAVTITAGGSGYTNGESVRIANASDSQSWGGAKAVVSTGAVTGLTDVAGGRCSGISTSGIYFEQVRRPLELGLQYQLLGVDLTGMYIGNGETSVIAARDSALHVGRVSGLEMPVCYAVGTGSESFIEWYDVTNGVGPTPFLEASTLRSKNVVGYANLFALNAGFTVTGRQNLICGKNIIQLNSDMAIGEEREYISPLIAANVALPATLAVEPTSGGGVITAIDVIDKNGTITCTLQVGYSANVSEALSIDPNTLTYNTGYARAASAADNKTIRPTFGLQVRTVVGAGTGTFRVRIRSRV
jgi:hypothetical protein